MAGFFGRNFATGLLIGCVIAVGVAAAAITYERYDTKTLKRGAESCPGSSGVGDSS